MLKFLKTPLQKAIAIIAGIVDVYSFFQIIIQTHFKMPDLINNAWFWLFVIVTVTSIGLFAYFKLRYYKQSIDEYKIRVSDELYKRMAEESNLHRRCNELNWQIQDLKAQLEQIRKDHVTDALH